MGVMNPAPNSGDLPGLSTKILLDVYSLSPKTQSDIFFKPDKIPATNLFLIGQPIK